MRPRYACRAAALALLLGWAGCDDPAWDWIGTGDTTANGDSGVAARNHAVNPADASSANSPLTPSERRPLVALQVRFDILLAQADRGAFSQSGKIWNHLDENAVDSQRSLLLQRNGLRVARGREEAWAPIRALLEQAGTVKTSANSMIMGNALPLLVEVEGLPRDQTLFLFRSDGSMGAASFPRSRNLLRIEYDLSLKDAEAVRILAMPEVRLPPQAVTYRPDRHQRGGTQWEEISRTLRELAFEMEVGSGEFIVIGPSRLAGTKGRGHLAGSLLLCEEQNGRETETIYFITPQLLRKGPAIGQ